MTAEQSGARAVELVRRNLRPRDIMTRPAFENALRVFMAMGGSTNAVIHLIAIAGRLRVPLSSDDFNLFSQTTPVLLDVIPNGAHLMADFDSAGGLPTLMRALQDLLHMDCMTVDGLLGETLQRAASQPGSVVRPRNNPLRTHGAIAMLHGNLAPRGAVIRTSTASEKLQQHTGPALVFNDYAEMLARIDRDDLPVTEASVLVLRNCGAVGVPGLPEWGAIPIPKKLLLRGVKDIVRISDSRMSGTSYGTVVLHIAPEAAIGGPLALVQDGDLISLDVPIHELTLHVSDDVLRQRHAEWVAPPAKHQRGYPRLYAEHVLQPECWAAI